MKHAEIIDRLGGYRLVAEKLRLHPTTVFKWTKDGIPAYQWPDIAAMARRRRKTADDKFGQITLDALAAGRSK